jgi:hypothetical protein
MVVKSSIHKQQLTTKLMETIALYQFKSVLPTNISENFPDEEDEDQRTQRDEHEKDEAIEEFIEPQVKDGEEMEICDPEEEKDKLRKKKGGGNVTHG